VRLGALRAWPGGLCHRNGRGGWAPATRAPLLRGVWSRNMAANRWEPAGLGATAATWQPATHQCAGALRCRPGPRAGHPAAQAQAATGCPGRQHTHGWRRGGTAPRSQLLRPRTGTAMHHALASSQDSLLWPTQPSLGRPSPDPPSPAQSCLLARPHMGTNEAGTPAPKPACAGEPGLQPRQVPGGRARRDWLGQATPTDAGRRRAAPSSPPPPKTAGRRHRALW